MDKSGWEILACSIEILQGLFHYIFFFLTYNPFLESQISHRGILLKRRGKDRSGVNLAFSCVLPPQGQWSLWVSSPFCAQFSSCLASLSTCTPLSIFLVALSPP